MFFDSIQFKAMESGLTALNMKQEVITHNIANIDTPDYKSYELNFGNMLEQAYQTNMKDDKDERKKTSSYDFKVKVTKNTDTSVLVDGNNVDVDEQSLELYSTYLQSSAIIQKMNAKISDVRYVLTQSNFK